MFTDDAYIQQTKDLIRKERSRIVSALREIDGLKVYDPTANFVLIRILREDVTADTMFDAAIREKMMIRNCSTFPFLDNKYIRFCFMNPEDNDRLVNCIRGIMNR